MIYIGIDPGASGGIAWIRDAGDAYNAAKMPETERDLYELLLHIRNGELAWAAIERVWSSPQMGVSSAFKFGVNVGTWRMALIAAGIRFDEVLPTTWQKAMGCRVGKSRATGGPVGGDKNITKRRAEALFPGIKVTHAIADALLIAEFYRRLHGGKATPIPAGGLFDGEDEEGKVGEGVWDEDHEEVEAPARSPARSRSHAAHTRRHTQAVEAGLGAAQATAGSVRRDGAAAARSRRERRA